MEYVMNQCKDCVVDMVCIKECPMFEVDIKRLQTDEEVYLKRCLNNNKNETYQISDNVKIEIFSCIRWYKNGKRHRDNNKPAIITYEGNRYWYKNGKIHRDNDQPAIIYYNGTQSWYTNGVRNEFM